MSAFDETLPVHTVVAGKLRRYHHLSLWQHVTWPSLMFHNLKDTFLVGIGFVQSLAKLIIWRPDVVFTKGGYVCLPVGMAARVLRIPLVIHDSDAHPGLTNRILSRWATKIATGAPLEYYSYPPKKTRYVGIPIDSRFAPATKKAQEQAKREWGIRPDRPLLVVTGGGLGAQRINDMIAKLLPSLQRFTSVILVAGAGQYDELRSLLPENSDVFQLYPFITTMPSLLAAADVVVTRAGATTILELAAAEKPIILLPNAKLTGGHQLKNAKVYGDAGAVVVLNEDEVEEHPERLADSVAAILKDTSGSKKMAKKFGTFAKPQAAQDMARLILEARK